MMECWKVVVLPPEAKDNGEKVKNGDGCIEVRERIVVIGRGDACGMRRLVGSKVREFQVLLSGP